MDIENLDSELVEGLGGIYLYASFHYEKYIENPSAKIYKKIRKAANNKDYFNLQPLSDDMAEYLNGLCDEEFFVLCKSCSEYISTHGTAEEQRIKKLCENLSKDVAQAVLSLFDEEFFSECDVKRSNGVCEFTVNSSAAYESKLILLNAQYSTDKKFEMLYFDGKFENENGVYKLICQADSGENGEFELAISFTDARVETKFFNPTNAFTTENPWNQLSIIARSIFLKKEYENSFNRQEREILPLLGELKNLSWFFDEESYSFANFKGLISKHQFTELLPLIEKIEFHGVDAKRRSSLTVRLINKLNLIKYRPLWDEIYTLICESQRDYPMYIQEKAPKAELDKIKNEVNGFMKNHGYLGEYPDFYKNGAVNGVKMIESYGVSYTVAFEKNAVHYVRCLEERISSTNGISVEFLCATEFLKRNESATDITSCRFNCNGRKYAKHIFFHDDYYADKSTPIKERLNIAVKCAELKKLNKSERKKTFHISYTLRDKLIIFLLFSLFAGFVFSSLFTPAMMGFAALMLWIDGMPVVISDIPWLIIYFAVWIGFGVPTGLLSIISKR